MSTDNGAATGERDRVDWANACRGPVGCDIATCHANLLDWASEDIAERFVNAVSFTS